MERVHVECADGVVRGVVAYNVSDFPYFDFRFIPTLERGKRKIANIISTFDIETTTVDRRKIGGKCEGYMYHWQFCIGGIVCFGRTWDELMEFWQRLTRTMNITLKKHLVVYVHNLSFEFQFLRMFYEWDSMFAKEKREVLKAVTGGGIEFRCSYYLSNMGLEKFLEQGKNVKFRKQSGEKYDYRKIRTPKTPMSNYEKSYCYCDVMGLYERLLDYMEEDDLFSIPMTSTSFVRRDCRNAMKKNPDNRKMFLKTALNKEVYTLLQEEKRGGNTHAYRAIVGTSLENLKCLDYASSYPYQMMTQYFPMSAFTHIENVSRETFYNLCTSSCCLFRASFVNLRCKADIQVPYVAHAKCRKYTKKDIVFNGRVLYSPTCQMTLNEIDYDIIERQYLWDELYISDFWFATRGQLPEELKEQIRIYFDGKTNLKGVDDYMYMKSKNLINSIFGMACTDPVHDTIYIGEDGLWYIDKNDVQDELDKYYRSRNSFLPVQWGNWVTAHARKWLQEMLDISGVNTVYTDTDSDKMQDVDMNKFQPLVEHAKQLCDKYKAYAEKDGKRVYMGIPEYDGTYIAFRTWGAKKYAYIEKDKKDIPRLHITVAGVHKQKGAKCLIREARIEAKRRGIKSHADTNRIALELFDIGHIWKGEENGGGSESHWNDDGLHYITVNGEKILTGANVGIIDSSYTLGVTEEFIENMHFSIDTITEF